MSTRTVTAADFGGPEQLRLQTVPTPEPGPGEVRVAVRAISVNPVDWKLYGGLFGRDPGLLTGFGAEVAGTVDAVGDDVTSYGVGDEVVVRSVPGGAYADHVVAPADLLTAKPAGVSWEVAASVPVVGGTAVHALEAVHLGQGESVVVHGGSGGVGRLVVQLAVRRGARVVATASERHHDDLRALGAEPVAYGEGLLERLRSAAPDGRFDAAVDTVGTDEALDTSVALVADPQRVVTIAGFARFQELGIKAIGSGPGADPGEDVRAAAVPQVLDLLAGGDVTIPVARTYPLEETAEAHRVSRDAHPGGKLVVLP